MARPFGAGLVLWVGDGQRMMGKGAEAAVLAGVDLTLWRGTTRLFERLAFSVAPGTALLVEGPNGSGKTTLLRVIAGLTQPETGDVTWSGAGLTDQVSAGVLRLAFSQHGLALKPELTARENLVFHATLTGQRGGVGAAIDVTGLTECADLPVRLLSAGQKRRASLARVLLSAADLWLLDEPQTNLDAAGREYLERALQAHVGNGGTLVVATHQAIGLGQSPVTRLTLGAG